MLVIILLWHYFEVQYFMYIQLVPCKAIIINKNSAVDCARFVESTSTAIQPSRAATCTIHFAIHYVPVDEGFPGLLPYLYLLEIDQALKVAALLSCQATS